MNFGNKISLYECCYSDIGYSEVIKIINTTPWLQCLLVSVRLRLHFRLSFEVLGWVRSENGVEINVASMKLLCRTVGHTYILMVKRDRIFKCSIRHYSPPEICWCIMLHIYVIIFLNLYSPLFSIVTTKTWFKFYILSTFY